MDKKSCPGAYKRPRLSYAPVVVAVAILAVLVSAAVLGVANASGSRLGPGRTESVITHGGSISVPETCPAQFVDVPLGSTYYDYVRFLACNDMAGGYPDGTFRP